MATSSRLRVALSEFLRGAVGLPSPRTDPPLHPTELDLIQSMRSSRVKRALLALAGFSDRVSASVLRPTHCLAVPRQYGQRNDREFIATSLPGWRRRPRPVADAAPAASAKRLLPISSQPYRAVSLLCAKASTSSAADITKLQATKLGTRSARMSGSAAGLRLLRRKRVGAPGAQAPRRRHKRRRSG